MTMDGLRVEPLTLNEVRQVYRAYMVHDFPRNERKSLGMIESALQRGEYQCFGAKAGDEIIAYAFFVRLRQAERALCLFDYLAVRSEARGQGIGSAFLRALSDQVLDGADCVLLEVDDPDFAEDAEERALRERRLHFYLKNGLRDTGLRAHVFGVQYRVLEIALHAPHTREQARQVYEALYRSFLSPAQYARMVETQ